MLDPNNGQAWIQALQNEFVWTREISGIEDDPTLPHVILGAGLSIEGHVLGGDETYASCSEWNRLLAWIEENFPGGANDATYVNNLIHVSFAEEFVQSETELIQLVRRRLAPFPKLAQAYSVMEAYWIRGIRGQKAL